MLHKFFETTSKFFKNEKKKKKKSETLKGIVSDSYNTCFRHKSEDINQKRVFSKFQFILIFRVQVMHAYVHWHCSIDYSVKLILGHENLC